MNSKTQPMRSTNSAPETVQDMQKRAQPLRECDQCGNKGESTGGVEMRGKWVCAKCWVKYVNSK